MKITRRQLRRLIREQLEMLSQPLSKSDEFVTGSDVLAGYIVVSAAHDGMPVGYAPIVRTDGPDRPFLVRTTDTSWILPHSMVKALYPQVEDAFNWVDSKGDWRDLGPGSRGTVGNFSWEWVEDEPTISPNDHNLI